MEEERKTGIGRLLATIPAWLPLTPAQAGCPPQFMNCSLPTKPILVTPSRWALAITKTTFL